MAFGHAHKEPNEDHVKELARLEKLPWFKAGRKIKYVVDHSHFIYYLGGSSIDGKRIYVDAKQYPTIKKDKLLDGLIEHEVVEGILLRHGGYTYQGAHEIATAAEDLVYKRAGVDPTKNQAKYPKLIKAAEGEEFKNVPKDLRLDPYSGELLKKMKAAQKAVPPSTLASMKRSLDGGYRRSTS